MTATAGVSGIEELRAAVRGQVCAAGDLGYDDARRVWNAQIDRHPARVVYCLDAEDVSATVRWARAAGLGLTVRGGAHNASGSAVFDGEVMINLARCNAVEIDAAARIARVGGGALLGQFDAAAQEHGLATPAGVVSHTGVGGLTLGGGLGWLSRDHGLTVDNLLGAEVVLADGSIVRADATEHPDLFWALKGGGGNFGVVTQFEFRLHPVGPIVHFGMLFWGLENAAVGLRACRELAHDLPPGFGFILAGLNAPPAPFVPQEHHFTPGFAAMLVGFSDPEGHAEHVERLREECPPLFDLLTPMPYLALQSMFDEPNAWGSYVYEKGTSLPELTDEAVEILLDRLPRRAAPTSVLMLYLMDGAYCEPAEDATAFGGLRQRHWATFVVGLNHTAATWTAEREWVRGTYDALLPHAMGVGSYVNSMAEADLDAVRAAYGHNYERLGRIKATYDPANVFKRNANIAPAG
ncbi:MAG: FAD-binding oxidoreductase [Sporichthyaceae bacterium]